MRKKIAKFLLCSLLTLSCVISLTACPATKCAHQWGGWTVLTRPTCENEGEQWRRCTLCHMEQTAVIQKEPHEYVSGKCTFCQYVCEHIDQDENKYCDACQNSVVVKLDFYALNDLHGKMLDTDSQPGVDELTTYLKNAYKTEENVIVLASGDMWQGSSESNLTRGNMMTEWLNEIGTVSMTLGNHEFDWDNQYIHSNINLAKFPFLALNIYDKQTQRRADYAEPSVIVERSGVKIGVIGAIGDCHSSISQDKVTDVEFKVGNELTALVKAESQRLRGEGCDFIVYSIHDGYEDGANGVKDVSDNQLAAYYDVALSDGYVDLVFESHTHQDYILRDSKGVYHLQAGGENRAISYAEITLNTVTNEYTVSACDTVSSYVYDDCASDSIIGVLSDKYGEQIAKGEELLGTNSLRRSSEELKQLCADLYMEMGDGAWGSSYDIVLGGGFISVRTPYELPKGKVYYRDIYSLFPFDNELYLCSIKGADLLDRFMYTSNKNYFVCYTKYGNSIKENIDRNATYYIVTDGYSAYYAPNRLTIIEKHPCNLYARDFIAEYIKNGGFYLPSPGGFNGSSLNS